MKSGCNGSNHFRPPRTCLNNISLHDSGHQPNGHRARRVGVTITKATFIKKSEFLNQKLNA